MARLSTAVAVLLACLLGVPLARGQSATEQEVKAAYLYRFTSFIEWPAGRAPAAGAPFTIGVVEAPDVADALEQIVAGKTVEGRAIRVRRLAASEGFSGVQLLFVGRTAGSRLGTLARSLPAGTLLVTESDGALDQGSAINFVVGGGRVRFAVSLPAAQHAGLRISARMLAVATEVRGERP